MRKLFILLFLIIYGLTFAQTWNSIVPTTISPSYMLNINQFTNKNGNHVIVYKLDYPASTKSLIYYNLNSAGSFISSYTIETISNGMIEFPQISGSDDNIYVVYRSGNVIKTWKSTNVGITWNQNQPISVSTNTCMGVDLAYNSYGLHVVWSNKDKGSDYATYYYRYRSSDENLVDYKEITDFSNGKGGRPSIILSANKVHVSFDMGQYEPAVNGGLAYTRDKFFNNNYWEDPQQATTSQVMITKSIVQGSTLFMFYLVTHSDGGGSYTSDLYYKTRDVNGANWTSSGVLFKSTSGLGISLKSTINGNLNIVYDYAGISMEWRYLNGSTWSPEVSLGSYNSTFALSSVDNDLFLIYPGSSQGNSSVNYRQYNSPPAIPANFNLTTSAAYHPYLTWSLNSDPDVYSNISHGYYLERRLRANTNPVTWSSWSTIGTLNGTTNHFEDTYINNATGAGPGVAEYRLKANDNVYDSPYTNSLDITYGTSSQKIVGKYNNTDLTTYNLLQNFPNPFNPSTEIYYQIPSDGNVKLKVYNLMGQEIMELVNGFKEKGLHSVTFNAGNLASGFYMYKLETENFSQVKKMLLTK